MKTQIEFRRIANVKILVGILLAASLFPVFAFGQGDHTKSQKSEQTQEKVYDKVDQMPEFPGGQSELINFMVKSISYPAEAKKKGIQGKVFVEFVIGKDGAIRDVKVAKGVDPMLDAEAVRVVSSMPNWVPGVEKGKQVSVQYTLPINFALK